MYIPVSGSSNLALYTPLADQLVDRGHQVSCHNSLIQLNRTIMYKLGNDRDQHCPTRESRTNQYPRINFRLLILQRWSVSLSCLGEQSIHLGKSSESESLLQVNATGPLGGLEASGHSVNHFLPWQQKMRLRFRKIKKKKWQPWQSLKLFVEQINPFLINFPSVITSPLFNEMGVLLGNDLTVFNGIKQLKRNHWLTRTQSSFCVFEVVLVTSDLVI